MLIQQAKNYLYHLPKAILANLVYGFPSKRLTVIGVTGTSGKTTTVHLIHHILNKSGLSASLISSVTAKIGNQDQETGLHVTNPEPFLLQSLIKKIADKGIKYVVLEVTSHGLDQFRSWGIKFSYGVITNLNHEHLDYHGSLQNYHQAKLRLFKASDKAVINLNDARLKRIKADLDQPIITFSGKDETILPKSLPGDFNRLNVAAAQAVAKDLGLSKKKINQALTTFPGIPGRMEIVQKSPFKIIVDFAHKPDALKEALTSIAKLKGSKGRLICLFGAAGLRDSLKRPIMGKIAAQLADITILTAEDPRTEKVADINNQIESGFKTVKKGRLFREPDRQKAINMAIALAKPKDFVVLFGKAHEKSMCFGKIEYPWNEFRAVSIALKQRRKS